MSLSWQSITKNDVEKLSAEPTRYFHAIVQHKRWDLLEKELAVDSRRRNVLSALKHKNTRREFLRDRSTDDILAMLDRSSNDVRRVLLQTLILLSDTFENSIAVGVKILNNLARHPWGHDFLFEVYSLQPDEAIRAVLGNRVSSKLIDDMIVIPSVWNKLVSGGDGEDVIDTKGMSINENFVAFRYLRARSSMWKLALGVFVEAMAKCRDRKKWSEAGDAWKNLEFMRKSWNKNDEVRKEIHDAILQADERWLAKRCKELVGEHKSSDDCTSALTLKVMIRLGILTNDEIMKVIMTKTAVTESLSRWLASSVLGGKHDPIFLAMLKDMSKNNKDNALATMWPLIVKQLPTILLDEVLGEKFEHFSFIAGALNGKIKYHEGPYKHMLSWDEIMALLKYVVDGVIADKKKIVESSPEKYTNIMFGILSALTMVKWTNCGCRFSCNSRSTVFFHMSAEFRDEMILEAVCDPAASTRTLNSKLTMGSEVSVLSMILLMDDLGKIASVVPGAKPTEYDANGFRDGVTFTFSPLMTQEDRSSEEWKGCAHVIERSLFKIIRDKTDGADSAAKQWQGLVLKVMTKGLAEDNMDLCKKGIDMHARLCRYALGKTAVWENSNGIAIFIEMACHPLVVAGYVKTGASVATSICQNLLAKAPVSTPRYTMVFMNLLDAVVKFSYCRELPDIDDEMGVIAAYCVSRVYDTMPASFNIETVTPVAFDLATGPSSAQTSTMRGIVNALADLSWPEGYYRKVMKRMFIKDVEACERVFCDPSLLRPDALEAIGDPVLSAGAKPVSAVLRFLKTKIDDYKTIRNANEQRASAIVRLIGWIKGIVMKSDNRCIEVPIPDLAEGWENNHDGDYYTLLIASITGLDMTLTKGTVMFVLHALDERHWVRRFLQCDGADVAFGLLDDVLMFEPPPVQSSVSAAAATVKNPISIALTTSMTRNIANEVRMRSVDFMHSRKTGGRKVRRREYKLENETCKIMSGVYGELLGRVLQCDPETDICDRVRFDGNALLHVLTRLRKWFCVSACGSEALVKMLMKIMNVLVSDVLINTPEPTEANPNPKPARTLFRNEQGHVTYVANKGMTRRNVPKSVTPCSAEMVGTTKMLGQVANMIRVIAESGKVDCSGVGLELATCLDPLLEHQATLLKTKLGDPPVSYWAGQIAMTCLHFADFGDSVKDGSWVESVNGTIYGTVFKMLGCDLFHHIVLGLIGQRLEETSSVPRRLAIITGINDALAKMSVSFTLKTRMNAVIWAMDPALVGYPLPEECMKYVTAIAAEEKVHIDLKKTLVTATVAYFKQQEMREIGPLQVDDLFGAMKKLYDASKVGLIPIFCQLTRPELCESLESKYADLLPSGRAPCDLIPNRWHGELEIPSSGVWASVYDQYISCFIAGSLLCPQENILELVVRVLTDIGVKGGRVSENVAPFVAKACNEINIGTPSDVLLDFAFQFCSIPEHQSMSSVIDSFMSVFERTRAQLDKVDGQQALLMWTGNKKYDSKQYQGVNEVINGLNSAFNRALVDVGPASATVWNSLCKRVLVVLDGDKPPTMRCEAFDLLRFNVSVIANEHFVGAMEPTRGELVMEELLALMKDIVLSVESARFAIPDHVVAQFHANESSMTLRQLLSLKDFPDVVVNQRTACKLMTTTIRASLKNLSQAEVDSVLPALWRFGQ